ncbi:hypothetical protein EIP86_009898 [Pleurotus ostreatoroseus]|nr:hypothetical protein EIP86_009898 [Pleurotus ostreatoroseus]
MEKEEEKLSVVEVDTRPLTFTPPDATQDASQRDLEVADTHVQPPNPLSLPPADGGFSAWSFLLAGFLSDILLWGFPASSGILLAAWVSDPVYSSQNHAGSLLPLVGTVCTGIMYCSGTSLQ